MTAKTFALRAEDIRPLAPGRGGCVATDMITVLGRPVGYMVREPTTRPGDSGWSFSSGEESREYMDEADNHGVYEVNTIANVSPDIVPLLDAPPGSAFIRHPSTGTFVPVPYPEPGA